MRVCFFAVVALTLFCPPARAEFVLQFDPYAKVLANAPDQVVDLYLTSTATVYISELRLRAFLGDERGDVTPDSGSYPPSHLGSKGNFEKGGLYAYGVQADGEGYLWGDNPTVNVYNAPDYGQNVTEVEISGQQQMKLEGGQSVKVATLHIDTTTLSGSQLNIGLAQDDYFNNASSFYTRVVAADPSNLRAGTPYTIDNGLTILGGEYQISSTPEPSIIGLAGLSLAAGAGWLRSGRRRRRKFG